MDRSKRPPFQKYTILCSTFQTWVDRKDPRFKKIYVSLLFSAPKSPVSPVRSRSESPPFSVRGRSLSPPFSNPVREGRGTVHDAQSIFSLQNCSAVSSKTAKPGVAEYSLNMGLGIVVWPNMFFRHWLKVPFHLSRIVTKPTNWHVHPV